MCYLIRLQICKEEQENQAKLIEKEVKVAVAKVTASYEERLSATRAENSLKIQQGKNFHQSLSSTCMQMSCRQRLPLPTRYVVIALGNLDFNITLFNIHWRLEESALSPNLQIRGSRDLQNSYSF